MEPSKPGFGKGLLRYIFATPQRKDDKLNMRVWFAGFLCYLVAVCLICQWSYWQYSSYGVNWAKTVWFLGLYVFYFSLACTYIPLPTAVCVLLLASPASGLTVLPPAVRILAVAALGAFASGISHVNEYYLTTYLLRLGKVHLIRQTRIYQWAQRHFKVAPFLVLTAFNIVPVPADPARWLAIISAYPLKKYFFAQVVGRFIRYGVLALIADYLKLNVLQTIILAAVLIVVSFALAAVQKIRQRQTPAIE